MHMEIIEVKEYNPIYFVAIQKLVNELGSHIQLSESYFREIISAENCYLFLLKEEECIIGMFSIGIYRTPTGSKGWIEDVVIDENTRGKGYGRVMMEYAISFVQSLQIQMLMLTSNPSRVAANKLYQSLGFEQKETNVYRMITNNSTK